MIYDEKICNNYEYSKALFSDVWKGHVYAFKNNSQNN